MRAAGLRAGARQTLAAEGAPRGAARKIRAMRSDQLDVVIIGAGHNGLTCACYLAAAGLKVRVVERRGIVGGAAVTEEFHPGFRNSTASYTVSLLNPKVIRDLRLAEHGLRIVERPLKPAACRLYQCGSGAHPGGGITGAPGHNAALEVIRDLR